MKKSILFFIIISCTGCSFFRKISSADNSYSSQNSSSNKNSNPQFLDNITISPGGNVPNYSSAQTPNHKEFYKPPDIKITTVDIERVDTLQLKYAIIFDATVEQLTNVILLHNINIWWATPYCYGGTSSRCIDCSAFVQTIMRNVYKTNVPRTSIDQYNSSKKIDVKDLHEGDLVFFNTEGSQVSHVGIYLLNNKFVHAATTNGVSVSDLNDGYWHQRFVGAGRVKN